MTNVFIVKDQTDRAAHKAYVRICRTEGSAKSYVAELQSQLSLEDGALISYEPIAVRDYDEAKTTLYVLFDKTESAVKKGILDMFCTFSLASEKLNVLRSKVELHVQKLIYVNAEKLV